LGFTSYFLSFVGLTFWFVCPLGTRSGFSDKMSSIWISLPFVCPDSNHSTVTFSTRLQCGCYHLSVMYSLWHLLKFHSFLYPWSLNKYYRAPAMTIRYNIQLWTALKLWNKQELTTESRSLFDIITQKRNSTKSSTVASMFTLLL
jgi:hypothetical protein